MTRPHLLLLILALVTAGGLVSSLLYQRFRNQPVHFHAGYQVYVDGTLQDFSADKYMYAEQCAVSGSQPSNDALAWVHLHDKVGNVVHVHKAGVVWGQLFTNIGFTVDPRKPLKAFINGVEADNFLTQPIKPYDSLVVVIGADQDIPALLNHQVTKTQIMAVENSAESCGSR